MHHGSYQVLSISYSSYCISFAEWVNIFRLCPAPLFAHIISGTPSPSYLALTRPKWYDRLCIYNPTSILWRYAVIADRRIRAKSWHHNDLAAANAII